MTAGALVFFSRVQVRTHFTSVTTFLIWQVRTHFTAFELPPPIADQIIGCLPEKRAKPLTPLVMRAYLRRKLGEQKKREARLASRAWAPLHSANFCLDLMAFCLRDLSERSYSELRELHLLPLASGALGRLGASDGILVASAKQQALLPHLAPRFASAQCVAHPQVGSLFAGMSRSRFI